MALLAGPREARAAEPGKPITLEAPPAETHTACSFRRAICVHAPDGPTALSVLDATERAWETGVVLGVPLPSTFDAYVSSETSRSAISRRDGLSRIDRTHTYAIVDGRLAAGCARDFDAARELYASSALANAPAIDTGSLHGEATALARLAVPCATLDSTAFQSAPDRTVVDRNSGLRYAEGSSLFFSWLDDSFAKEPGHVLTASWSLAPTKTTDDYAWNAEPDVFDVLRESTKDGAAPGSTFDDALQSFAIARATEYDTPVRLDWDVAWPTTARTLASPEGISPTGAAYVRIDTRGRKPGARLRLDATTEELAKIRWTALTLDASGHVIARLDAKAPPKSTEAHLQIVDVGEASAVLVVAANTGAWSTPFDPEDDDWEPHGWLLTLAAE